VFCVIEQKMLEVLYIFDGCKSAILFIKGNIFATTIPYA